MDGRPEARWHFHFKMMRMIFTMYRAISKLYLIGFRINLPETTADDFITDLKVMDHNLWCHYTFMKAHA